MIFTPHFSSKKSWLKGGIIGIAVCLLLSLFYAEIYFPILDKVYGNNKPSDQALLLPLTTGHIFPFLSGFIVPYGFLCKPTVPFCTEWSISPNGLPERLTASPDGVPWTENGQQGYCLNVIMQPTTMCANISGQVGFWGLALILLASYFVVGAIIGWGIGKRKRVIPQDNAIDSTIINR